MIFLFGDSWARMSAKHLDNPTQQYKTTSTLKDGKVFCTSNTPAYGYEHWAHKDIFVEFQTNDWFNRYFKNHSVINFSEGGNTNSLILENIRTRICSVSNLVASVNVVIYQTDPMRIFAPKVDYSHKGTVWNNFVNWANNNNFDYTTCGLEDLLLVIFNSFYAGLILLKQEVKELHNLDINLHIVGGVSKVYPTISNYPIPVLIESVSEFFGYNNDNVIENSLALQWFIKFWSDEIPAMRSQLMSEGAQYDKEVMRKEKFWSNTPVWFAGRHLTTAAMQQLANYIESKIDLASREITHAGCRQQQTD
jgi:hypothetical protein